MSGTTLLAPNGQQSAAPAPPVTSTPPVAVASLEQVLFQGDLSRLTGEERLAYLREICTSLGLNPLTRPVELIQFKTGKLQLYVTKDGAAQLGRNHDISTELVSREVVNGVLVVTARATIPGGKGKAKRVCDDYGAVPIEGLAAEGLANAIKKGATQARRRATLAVCGLGFLDESEVYAPPAPVVTPQEYAQPPQSLPAPVAPAAPPEPLANGAQVSQLQRLRRELSPPDAAWQKMLADRGVTDERQLTEVRAIHLIQLLEARAAQKRSAPQPQPVTQGAGPDGLGGFRRPVV